MKKNSPPPPQIFFLPFFYATFQCGHYNFCPQKVEKTALKVAHNRPKPFISQSSPDHSPELIFRIIKCREQASVLLSVFSTPIR